MTKNTAISRLEGAKLIPFSYQYNWVKCQDDIIMHKFPKALRTLIVLSHNSRRRSVLLCIYIKMHVWVELNIKLLL